MSDLSSPDETGRAPKLSSRQVLDALARRYPLREWIFIEQLRAATGFGVPRWTSELGYHTGRGEDAVEQTLDAWAMQLWSPREIHAFEVKVSRGDFLREAKDPNKRAFGLLTSTHFYFVTPVRLLRPDEIPPECGLIEVYENGRVRTRIKAPAHEAGRPAWSFVSSALRRMRRAGFEQGPGHAGQCDGWTWERVQETFPSGEPYSRSMRVHLVDSGRWCAKEFGHNGGCLVRGPAKAL